MTKPIKPISAPPVPAPEAIPQADEFGEAGDEARKKTRAKRKDVFLTGALAPENLEKKKLLG